MKIVQILVLVLSTCVMVSAGGTLDKLFKIKKSKSADLSLRSVAQSWKNINVVRVLDLQKRNAVETVELTALWLGKDTNYKIPITIAKEAHLASLIVNVKRDNTEEYEKLFFIKEPRNLKIRDEEFVMYSVNLAKFLQNKQELYLRIQYIYKHEIIPEPAKIALTETQKLRFTSHSNYLSAYTQEVNSLSVLINSASDRYVDFTTLSEQGKPTEVQNLLLYKFKDNKVERFEAGQVLSVLYRSPVALVYFEQVIKQIEISHWGNIWIQENYHVVHEGAQIKKEFSRADYSPAYAQNGRWAFRGMQTALPLRTRGLYYGDVIGNISTSSAFRQDNRVDLSINTRFPLFGGQQVKFHQGYNLPLENYAVYNPGTTHYHLTLSFMYSYFQKIAEKYIIEIVLPAGAKLVKTSLPFETKIDSSQVNFGYLDLFGKQKIIIELEDATQAYNLQFEIEYEYSRVNLIVKPVFLIGLFFGGLVVILLANRTDFSIKRKKRE